MKKRRLSLTMNVGIISFMVVFIILCLVTFSVLSLVSAKSNLASANKSLSHSQTYYALNNQAQDKLEVIDQTLYDYYKQSSSSASYFAKIKGLEKKDPSLQVKGKQVSFSLVKGSMKLVVSLKVTYPGKALYTVTKWQEQSSKDWNADEKIDIL